MKLKCRIKNLCPGMELIDILLLIGIAFFGLLLIAWMVIDGN
jgi:hypothetical protein